MSSALFCREEEAVREFDASNAQLTKLNEFVGKLSALLNPVTYVLINIATVILINNAGLRSISEICSRDRSLLFITIWLR